MERFRNLAEELEGVVIKCATVEKIEECFKTGVCTAPGEHYAYLQHLKKNRPIFLFQTDKRLLHGVLRAGGLEQGPGQTLLWVRATVVSRSNPLRECDFSPKIQRCYFSAKEFYCELNMEETLEIFKVFDDLPVPNTVHDAGHSPFPETSQLPEHCGQLSIQTSAASAMDIASVHGTPTCEGTSGKKIEGSGYLVNREMDNCLSDDDAFSSTFPYSVKNGINAEAQMDTVARIQGQLSGLNLDSTVLFAVQEQTEDETKKLPFPPGSKVENKIFQQNAGFGANCLPVLFGNQAAKEEIPTFSHQAETFADDKMNSASVGQMLHPVAATNSIPASASPSVSNDKSGVYEDALKMRQENSVMEISHLREECRKIGAEEIRSRHRAEKLEATLQSEAANSRKLMDELLQSKMDNKQLREENCELAASIKLAKSQLAEAQEGLRTARRVQETLLKIQNETMDEMDRKRAEHLELRVKFQEVLAKNKLLEGKLDRWTASGDNFGCMRGAMDETTNQEMAWRGTARIHNATGSNQHVKNDYDYFRDSIHDGSERASELDGSTPGKEQLQDPCASTPRCVSFLSVPQKSADSYSDVVPPTEDARYKQPSVCGYPPGLGPKPALDVENLQGSDPVQSGDQESVGPVISSCQALPDQKQEPASTALCYPMEQDTVYSLPTTNQFSQLPKVEDAPTDTSANREEESRPISPATLYPPPVIPRPSMSSTRQDRAPFEKNSGLRSREDDCGDSDQQESKKKQKRDFSSIHELPVPIIQPGSLKTDISDSEQRSKTPSTLDDCSDTNIASMKALPVDSTETQSMLLPIPALMQTPLSVCPVLPAFAQETKASPKTKEESGVADAAVLKCNTDSSYLCSPPLPVISSTPVEEREKDIIADGPALDLCSRAADAIIPIPNFTGSCEDKEGTVGNCKLKDPLRDLAVQLPVPNIPQDHTGTLEPQTCKELPEQIPLEVGEEERTIVFDLQTETLGQKAEGAEDIQDDAGFESATGSKEVSSRTNYQIAAHVQQNSLLVFGGKNESEADIRMGQVYNIASGEWSSIPDYTLPADLQVSGLASVCYAGTVFLAGGMPATGTPDGSFYSLSLSTGTWKQLPNIPSARAASELVETDGKIYVVGGRNLEKSSVAVDVFDPEACKWINGPPMKSQRAYHSSVTCGRCIFSVGGMFSKELLSSAERLDPRVGVWEYIAKMSSTRTALGCASDSNHIVAAGGVTCPNRGSDYSVLNSTEIYDPRRNMWSQGIPMVEPRAWFSLSCLNNCLYAIGGKKTICLDQHSGVEILNMHQYSSWALARDSAKPAFHTCCTIKSI